MTTAQAIMQLLKTLPDHAQKEVLDFVEFMGSRRERAMDSADEDNAWSDFSLASAMRGMEDEEPDYSPADLKESFS